MEVQVTSKLVVNGKGQIMAYKLPDIELHEEWNFEEFQLQEFDAKEIYIGIGTGRGIEIWEYEGRITVEALDDSIAPPPQEGGEFSTIELLPNERVRIYHHETCSWIKVYE